MRFKCPECSADGVEEIMINATVSSPIDFITHFGPDYGIPTISDGDVDRHECTHCSFVLMLGKDKVDDTEGLMRWLYKNDMLDDDEVKDVEERFEGEEWINDNEACKSS